MVTKNEQISAGTTSAKESTTRIILFSPVESTTEWVHFPTRKKISFSNPQVRTEIELGRFPVIPGDKKNNIGGFIKFYLNSLPVNSDDNSPFAGGRLFLRLSKDNSRYLNSPIGKTKVRDDLADAFEKLGVSNASTLHPHAVRGLFISKLANDPRVSGKQGMAVARHTTASAYLGYQKLGAKSDAARTASLLPSCEYQPEAKKAKKIRKDENEEEMIDLSERASPPTLYQQLSIESDPEDSKPAAAPSLQQPPVQAYASGSHSVSSRNDAFFSFHTQMEMDGLEHDMVKFELEENAPRFHMGQGIGSVPVTPSSSSRHDNTYHPRPHSRQSFPIPRHNLRHSYPPPAAHRAPPTRARRAAQFRRSYPPPARLPPFQQQYAHHVPSRRQMEIQVVRDRIAALRTQSQDALNGYPYRNDVHERESLYLDAMQDEYDNENVQDLFI